MDSGRPRPSCAATTIEAFYAAAEITKWKIPRKKMLELDELLDKQKQGTSIWLRDECGSPESLTSNQH
jgi:hypothetical protein